MNTDELIRQYRKNSRYPKPRAQALADIENFLAVVAKALTDEERVNLRGVGILTTTLSEVGDKTYKNPRTGESFVKEGHKTLRAKFKPSKAIYGAYGLA
ncbi:hypothetical protein HMPREF7215_2556 [Pyramidobacter piscolens W5455]|uniref:DNA-binding protein HU n=1 Tax=Pyramidobacter piscolens W5455 TaxID=352165 RepID=A0ABP2HQU8_9BACT|nr:HU family DNA-binding protein [Pyramidobacter piscolens]EFB89742.1 hypothetical protein HMPREF7215_2556 [Pyramidobacter piscolens W5455]